MKKNKGYRKKYKVQRPKDTNKLSVIDKACTVRETAIIKEIGTFRIIISAIQ